MKKLLALCLVIVLTISLLTSCSINNYKPISIKYQNSDYAAYNDGEPKTLLIDLLNNSKWHNDVAKCDCDYTVIMKNMREIFYHSECGTFIDYDFNKSLTVSEEDRVKLNDYFADAICRSGVHFFDGNQMCTACGYVALKHEHTGEWYKNDEIHFYEYTCGCETKDIAELHLDDDGNGLCDICSYQMVAEGNHFIRNQEGAEWLCEITADDISEIKMISGGGGPLPPVSFTHISSSRNKAVISSIFEEYYWLDSKPVSEESTQIPDGGYFVVQFILNSGEVKQLSFINGDFYDDGNGNYFEIVRLPVFRDGTNFVTRYGFERQYNPCLIHLIDETPVCEIPLSEFEFTELTDDIYLNDEPSAHYIEIHGERVYFIKDCYFYIGDNRSVYYQLVGKNLDELIAEYSTNE